MKDPARNISKKEAYTRPEINRVILDNSISLVMMTEIPPNPPPRDNFRKGNDSPFESPFGNKPFA
ncbi:MAG: hypothetical protein GX876_10735 [Bacteroidales bacterium]|nr:hypothetical protein [Bacteroidales bacterium]